MSHLMSKTCTVGSHVEWVASWSQVVDSPQLNSHWLHFQRPQQAYQERRLGTHCIIGQKCTSFAKYIQAYCIGRLCYCVRKYCAQSLIPVVVRIATNVTLTRPHLRIPPLHKSPLMTSATEWASCDSHTQPKKILKNTSPVPLLRRYARHCKVSWGVEPTGAVTLLENAVITWKTSPMEVHTGKYACENMHTCCVVHPFVIFRLLSWTLRCLLWVTVLTRWAQIH